MKTKMYKAGQFVKTNAPGKYRMREGEPGYSCSNCCFKKLSDCVMSFPDCPYKIGMFGYIVKID